jgi:hypothetical protein
MKNTDEWNCFGFGNYKSKKYNYTTHSGGNCLELSTDLMGNSEYKNGFKVIFWYIFLFCKGYFMLIKKKFRSGTNGIMNFFFMVYVIIKINNTHMQIFCYQT